MRKRMKALKEVAANTLKVIKGALSDNFASSTFVFNFTHSFTTHKPFSSNVFSTINYFKKHYASSLSLS